MIRSGQPFSNYLQRATFYVGNVSIFFNRKVSCFFPEKRIKIYANNIFKNAKNCQTMDTIREISHCFSGKVSRVSKKDKNKCPFFNRPEILPHLEIFFFKFKIKIIYSQLCRNDLMLISYIIKECLLSLYIY